MLIYTFLMIHSVLWIHMLANTCSKVLLGKKDF